MDRAIRSTLLSLPREVIDAALAEHDELGGEAFLARYGYRHAERWILRAEDVRLAVRFDRGQGHHATSLPSDKDTFSSAVTSWGKSLWPLILRRRPIDSAPRHSIRLSTKRDRESVRQVPTESDGDRVPIPSLEPPCRAGKDGRGA